jgi:hypothetical protein
MLRLTVGVRKIEAKTKARGFVVSHPFHDEAVKWMGHGASRSFDALRYGRSDDRPFGWSWDDRAFCEFGMTDHLGNSG